MAKLEDFILSRVRVKLLQVFLSDPDNMWYVRELTRTTGEEINAVRRELARMESVGLIRSEARGNRLYYQVNPGYDFFDELLQLVAKTTHLAAAIRKHKARLGKIKFVAFSSRFVRKMGRETPTDIDVLVVGTVVMSELGELISKEEQRRAAEINYTVMTVDEFAFRKERRDPFLLSILLQPRVVVMGDELDLVAGVPQPTVAS